MNIRDNIAATLQARMSWPQADACAGDVVSRFGRQMLDCPLTCQFCRCKPATQLLVTDFTSGRTMHLTCSECGQRSLPEARVIARSPSSAWLFTLVPDGVRANEIQDHVQPQR